MRRHQVLAVHAAPIRKTVAVERATLDLCPCHQVVAVEHRRTNQINIRLATIHPEVLLEEVELTPHPPLSQLSRLCICAARRCQRFAATAIL